MAYSNFQKASEFSEKALKAGFTTITISFLSAASWIAVAKNPEYAMKLLKGVQKPSSIDITGHHIYRRIKTINQNKGASIHLLPFEYLYYFRHIAHLALYEEFAPQLQTIYDMLEATCAQLADETAENQALFYTIKGALLKSMKKENDAVVYFEKVLEMQARLKNTEVHIILFAHEEMGEIRFSQKDFGRAEKSFKEILKQTENNKGLFFSETLQRRAYIALRQIREANESTSEKPKPVQERSFYTLGRTDKEKEKEKEKEKDQQEKEKEKKTKESKSSGEVRAQSWYFLHFVRRKKDLSAV